MSNSNPLKQRKTKLGPSTGVTYRERSFLDLANYQINVTARAEEYIGFSKITNNPSTVQPPEPAEAVQITTENGISIVTENGDYLIIE